MFIFPKRGISVSKSERLYNPIKKINALINQIQGDGYVEIHIEQNGLQSFVHKRGATVIDSEDNVNAYELFEDMSWVSELVEEEGQPEFP